ncbi:peptidylprolyl isomerase [Diaminobutyricibacter tongyongensis]|uniref:peptidylprolyl isomerase n=1 Tax=Leifsonia tongyongensis TaxID=1268043 RepID=A0A6L9XXN8_9MICO|nr:FKBP-type peptidyl-prolyl cis-trans isomerase [Diaminobutyricibacter tongyongensis]NEN06163.1 peptidylprolyl isomerase [Diaminobutyricibacter tongyongensis]
MPEASPPFPVDRTERGLVHRASALFVAAGLLLVTLTACSTDPNANCDTALTSGSASDVIHVSGKFGEQPTVKFPTPVRTSTSQRTTVITGSGPEVHTGQEVVVDFSIYNGTNGQLIQTTKYDPTSASALVVGKTIPGLDKGLQCATVGSRLAIAVSPKDGLGASASSVGVSPTDTVVIVVDVNKAYLPAANGAPQPGRPGFPTVVIAPGGRPGVTVPTTNPPTSLEVAVNKQGDGKTVTKSDTVVIHYTGVLWKERTVFDSTWDSGTPATLQLSTGQTAAGTSLPKGLVEGLIGQKVGSQVTIIVPPSKAFGSQGSGPVPQNATLVYVVDILGIV